MIVDQYGKPFKPGIGELLRRVTTWLPATRIITEPVPPEPANVFDILQLRRSCGAPPETITFRRPRLL